MLDTIQNITATRRASPYARYIDIKFELLGASEVKHFEVSVIPEPGKIRKRIIPCENVQSQQCLTMKYLRRDVAYQFEIQTFNKDNTYSRTVDTNLVPRATAPSNAVDVPAPRRYNLEKISDITISSLRYDEMGEEILIKWEPPIFGDDIMAYEMTRVLVKFGKVGSADVDKKRVEAEKTSCKLHLEKNHRYWITVIWEYWDVDEDIQREEKSHHKIWETDQTARNSNNEDKRKNNENAAMPEERNNGTSSNGTSSKRTTETQDEVITAEIPFFYKMAKRMKNDKWVFQGRFSYIFDEFKDNEIEHSVAIKVLGADVYEGQIGRYGDDVDKAKLAKRMVREAKHMLQLVQHPNIVRYINSCQDKEDPRVFLIFMERCSEKTLCERIADLSNHPEFKDRKYCKAIISHLTLAIHFMHDRRRPIYHRDIKPSNILFTENGRMVKVSDFGFSKKAYTNGDISKTDSKGTDGYRPPETYDEWREGIVNDRADVFSLGLVYFYILTKGKHPFGSNLQEQQHNIRRGNPVVEGLTGPDAALAKSLILSMIRKTPSNRPKMMEVMKHAYFWTVDVVVGFYIKVVDCLAEDSRRKQGSWENIDLGDEVKKFIQISGDAAKAAPDFPPSSLEGEDGVPNNSAVRRQISRMMKSRIFLEDFHKYTKRYVRIIHGILSRLEKDSNHNSDESDISGDEEEQEETNVDGNTDCDEIGTQQNVPKATVYEEEEACCQNLSNPMEENEDPIMHGVINKLTETERQGIRQSADLLKNVPTLIRHIDNVDDVVFEDSVSANESLDDKAESWCAVKSDFTISSEFLKESQKVNLRLAKRDLETTINNEENIKQIVTQALKFIGIYEENRRQEGGGRQQAKTAGNKLCASYVSYDKAAERIRKLNALVTTRKRSSATEWNEFKKLVDKLTQNSSEDLEPVLNNMVSTASRLCDWECKGSKMNWKLCIKEAGSRHRDGCTNCPCVELAENIDDVGEGVFDLIKYIRNWLVHLMEKKRKRQGDGMDTQEEVLNFISLALPELLLHVVEVMEDDLAQYVEDSKLKNTNFLPFPKEPVVAKKQHDLYMASDDCDGAT